MKETEFWLEMDDKTEIYVKKWVVDQPELIIQIVHGMGEHINRYNDFAAFLTRKDFSVYGNDHRGHGRTGKKQGHLGHMADDKGFIKTADDLYHINKTIQKENPGVPVIMLGHSMGSFLSRRFIQLYGHTLEGLILSGTAAHPGIQGKIATLAAMAEIKRLGVRTPSSFLNKMVFGRYTVAISNLQTKFDWLTRDREQIDKFMKDPFTGTVPSAGFFLNLFQGFNYIYNEKSNQNIPKNLPVLFITGTEDPVGNKTAGVFRVMNEYYRMGIKDITARFYEGGRHEMLNEINREEVYQDIHNWLLRFKK